MNKKITTIILILISILLIPKVNAENGCKPGPLEEIYYSQSDSRWGSNTYCPSANPNTFSGAGCMPSSYAMLVANLVDSNITAQDIYNDICSNSTLANTVRNAGASSLPNGSTSLTKAMNAKYGLSFRNLKGTAEHNLESVKKILKEPNKMILVSMKCPTPMKNASIQTRINSNGCLFSVSDSGHYIVLSNVTDEGQIVVLNPSGSSDGTNDITKNSYTDDMIQRQVLNVINQGLWEVTYTGDSCSVQGLEKGTYEKSGQKFQIGGSVIGSAGSSSSSSSSSSGTTKMKDGSKEDKYSDISSTFTIGNNTDTTTCETLLLNADGEKNPLGQFFDIIFIIIRVSAPTITILLSVIDYIKAAIAGKSEEEAKNVNKKTMIRIIVGVIILLLPSILELLFSIFGLYDLSTCNLGG